MFMSKGPSSGEWGWSCPTGDTGSKVLDGRQPLGELSAFPAPNALFLAASASPPLT